MRCARAGRRCSSTSPPAPSSCRASPPWRGRCRPPRPACPLVAESRVTERACPWQVHEDTSHVGAHTVELRLGVTEQKRDAAQARLPPAFSRLAVQESGPGRGIGTCRAEGHPYELCAGGQLENVRRDLRASACRAEGGQGCDGAAGRGGAVTGGVVTRIRFRQCYIIAHLRRPESPLD